jgi:hypothetical protein
MGQTERFIIVNISSWHILKEKFRELEEIKEEPTTKQAIGK